MQNRYLIGRAKKKKKVIVAALFKGAILFFIVSLTCFLFFPKRFPFFPNKE
jgi:hypothetical protein